MTHWLLEVSGTRFCKVWPDRHDFIFTRNKKNRNIINSSVNIINSSASCAYSQLLTMYKIR